MIKFSLKVIFITTLLQFLACDKKPIDSNELTIENEPYYKYAWHFKQSDTLVEKFNISPKSHINIESAWKITKGEGVKVAVIDNYFEISHQDLKENIIDFYSIDNPSGYIPNRTDDASHGLSVAGFIASPINATGLVGAAPKAKLILIQQLQDNDAHIIKAFEYAKNAGAKVINCSWGTENVSQIVAQKIKELKDGGITVIFASGNSPLGGYSLDAEQINDESELASVIGVGASNEYNDIAFYSNYGKNIDLLAPGGDTNILGILAIDDSGSFGNTLQRGLSNNYSFIDGTSFAAPIVAGVVALMISVNPNLTPDEIRDILIQTADKIGDVSYDANGFNEYRAYGKIDAKKAVEVAKSYLSQQ